MNETRTRVLLGSPIHQKPAILEQFLNSLLRLNLTNIELHFYLIDDNPDEASSQLLQQFTQSGRTVFLQSSGFHDAYIRDDTTHFWNSNLVWKVAGFKNLMIRRAEAFGYDYLFLIDSDLILHPDTLLHLIRTGKDIISEVFWTQWQPGTLLQPQVWMHDEYNQWEVLPGEQLSPEEINRRFHAFLMKMQQPGIYEVGGLGACTLISSRAITSGASYDRIHNISYWGEDRHFCIRAAALGIPLYVDTHYPALHLYRDSDLLKVPEFIRQTSGAEAGAGLESPDAPETGRGDGEAERDARYRAELEREGKGEANTGPDGRHEAKRSDAELNEAELGPEARDAPGAGRSDAEAERSDADAERERRSDTEAGRGDAETAREWRSDTEAERERRSDAEAELNEAELGPEARNASGAGRSDGDEAGAQAGGEETAAREVAPSDNGGAADRSDMQGAVDVAPVDKRALDASAEWDALWTEAEARRRLSKEPLPEGGGEIELPGTGLAAGADADAADGANASGRSAAHEAATGFSGAAANSAAVRRPKLTLTMIVKNEGSRFLRQVLQEHRKYIDEAVIIDDGSTDNTADICREVLQGIPLHLIRNNVSRFSNESELRKQQWEAVLQTNPEWILSLDADEIFEAGFPEEVDGLLRTDNCDLFCFRLYDFWDDTHYREDMYWRSHQSYRPFLLRYREDFTYLWNDLPQHCGRLPENIFELSHQLSNLRLKHLGWSKPEYRLEKYLRYMLLDPDGQYGWKEQYLSILDQHPHLMPWSE
ncbi:glycosyltransferase [Paenibacillus sp. IHB B 3415]|uniref:glycosyltransferase n=1 Tax=Paenibacillus sp. IHB B 3415 TaxID=867080 RepID=UPI0007C666E3|nr:glycosyltransferase [Paenibacillus sp. IHB B 3415]